MKMIKKLGAIVLAATLMFGNVMAIPVQAATLNVNKVVTLEGRTVSYTAIGNHESVTASITYTASSGKLKATMVAKECSYSYPLNYNDITKTSGVKTAPGAAYVTIDADSAYRITQVYCELYYDIFIGGTEYESKISFDEDVNIEY